MTNSSRSHSTSDAAFETLRDRIVNLEYPPGTMLGEKELCEEFGISRTPLREAIRKLEGMRLITVIPRFGTYVSAVDIHDVRCAFEVKIRLEQLAGELAAKKITENQLSRLEALLKDAEVLQQAPEHRQMVSIDSRFHQIVYEAAQNPILTEMLGNLHSICARLWTTSLTERIPITMVVSQLWQIHGALKSRDAVKTGKLIEEHVQYFIDSIKSQLL